MEPISILDLPPDQFRHALAEFQLDPAREAELIRQYRRTNSAFAPIYGLLERIEQEDREQGMRRASIVPVSRPEGMSVAEAVRSGQAQLAVPQGLLNAIGGVFQGVDAPYAAFQGLIPPEDMIGEALGTTGVSMGAGGMAAAPRGALRSAALGQADEVMETAAQRVARLLREGRADEVTDELMAQADDYELFRLYEAGETGADLPMDFESRMARARKMGFNPALHGTGVDIQAVDPSFFGRGRDLLGSGFYTSTNPRRANRYAPGRTDPETGERIYLEGANILPMMVRQNRPFDLTEQTGNAAREIGEAASADPYFSYEARTDNAAIRGAGGESVFVDAYHPRFATLTRMVEGLGPRNTSDILSDAGYSGVIGPEAGGNFVRVSYNPTDLRSSFARFDPRLSHLRNLNAANVDPLTGAAAVTASQQDDPLANLRAYIAASGGVLPR